MSFKKYLFHETILRTLEELDFVKPTLTQEETLPSILEGFNLRVSAQTGTGKTAAFLLPALQRLLTSRRDGKFPRVLILVPTRELALQVAKEAERFSKNLRDIKTVCIYGGTPYPVQNRQLARRYDILVATPGRLQDHIDRRRIDLSSVEMFILDEADRMLDMGFIEPVEKIASMLPEERQTLLFSATLKGNVIKLSQRLMRDAKEVVVKSTETSNALIEQRLYLADDLTHKFRLLDRILEDPEIKQTIVFTSTKRFADELMDDLVEKGHHAAALHGDMNQNNRSRTILRFRKGDLKILIATDVAARGIDIQTISHVINFDLPQTTEDYVHRIGRTGRAGATGLALSFASPKERHLVQRIEKYTGQNIQTHTIVGLEPSAKKSGKPPLSTRQPFRRKSFR